MSWSSQKKRGHVLYHLFCPKEIFLTFCILSQCSVVNTLPEYKYFHISESITSYTFLLVFKSVQSLQCKKAYMNFRSFEEYEKRFYVLCSYLACDRKK